MRENVVRLFDEPQPSRFDEVWALPRRRDNGRLAKSPLKGLAFIEAMSMPEPNTGCWLWLGPADRKGYGRISRVTYGVGAAHRYSLAAKAGSRAELHALHKCDQPSCVNPDHLFWGTPADNTADMMRKGRHRPTAAKGSACSTARLSEAEAREIKRSFKPRDPQFGGRALALRFGVDACTISDIVHGRTWRHVQ